jgi:hypothetical protein
MKFRAVATNFDELHLAFRARAEQLHVSRTALDGLCNTPDNYISKFLGPAKTRKGHLGTLGKILRGLGLRIVVIEDQAATQKILPRIKPRDETRVRHRDTSHMAAT